MIASRRIPAARPSGLYPVVCTTAAPLRIIALAGLAAPILGVVLAGDFTIAHLLSFVVRRVALTDGTEEALKNPLKFALRWQPSCRHRLAPNADPAVPLD